MSSNNRDVVDLIVEMNDSLRNNPMLETIAKLIIAKRIKRNIARNRELSESETEQINNVANLATLPAPAPAPPAPSAPAPSASVVSAPAPAPSAPAPSAPPAVAPASLEQWDGPIEDCNTDECKNTDYGDEELQRKITAAKNNGYFLYFNDYNNYKYIGGSDQEGIVCIYPDNELIDILNNNIKLMATQQIKVLYKITKDVTYYLYAHQHFKKIGFARGYAKGWDYTIKELDEYIKDPTKNPPNSWPQDKLITYCSKIMALYLRSLTKICNAVYQKITGNNIGTKDEILKKIKKFETNETMIREVESNLQEYVKKENGGTEYLIEKTGDRTYALVGGSINDPYYQKYLKYKGKYLKLKTGKF